MNRGAPRVGGEIVATLGEHQVSVVISPSDRSAILALYCQPTGHSRSAWIPVIRPGLPVTDPIRVVEILASHLVGFDDSSHRGLAHDFTLDSRIEDERLLASLTGDPVEVLLQLADTYGSILNLAPWVASRYRRAPIAPYRLLPGVHRGDAA